jgi:hypothetical protein
MNTVHFSMYVWDNESIELSQNWTLLTRQAEFPFAPFVGLEIQLPLQRAWQLRSVCWDVEKELFHCRCEDLYTDPSSIDGLDCDNWIERLASAGWKIYGQYPKEG